MKKLVYTGLGALMIMVFSFSASATTMDVNYGATKRVNFEYEGNAPSDYVAEFNVKLYGTDWDPYLSTIAYCVDLENLIYQKSYDVTLNPVTLGSSTYGSNNYLQAAWLMDKYSAEASGNIKKVSGLQLAIWDAIYGEGFTNNEPTATFGTIGHYYNGYYTSLSDETWDDAMWSSLGYNYAVTTYGGSNNVQQLLVQLDPVPEPATMLLLGMGIAGLGAAGRKRFKKNNVSGCRS
ncbi:PEP-CTERM sorting domain-containing protein [Desulfotignum phosphitoxidans]|uniref:PEP-CTERM motif anchor domain-containing protein n=1 Tax=Desulfotignum phosphitoxidans DSM 13687 TaxID=1286635 RepID=S0G6T8_9BACT|nr:PEP-CTERM sorting domain-containing protein [Desulfotignum phosphitoxidans]EMS80582.1 PEP-CTERM motif anchor domain-containing protein [Desulfotignum phosphitoxidans DSM 13687]